MPACTECGLKFDPAIFGRAPVACPHCGRALVKDSSAKWLGAARVASLAEAGYLVNLLGTMGVSARIFDDRSFSALTGSWDQTYVIQVPQDRISQAAKILRHEAAAASEEECELRDSCENQESDNLVFWRPVALMALAGVASFVVGQRVAEQSGDGQPRPYAQALVAAMEQLGRPLVTEPSDGRIRHRFLFHPQRQAWYVQSDFNGDGHYERVREFRGAAIVER